MNEGLVAVLVAVGTIAGVLLGVRIQARKDARRATPAGGRDIWIPTSLLVLLVAFVAVAASIGVGLLRDMADREQLFVRRPLEEVRITQGTAGQALGVWRGRTGDLEVDQASGGGRGSDGALRVSIDLPGRRDTAAVQVSGQNLPEGVALATAWVYVDSSRAARDAGLHVQLVGRLNAGSNGRFSLVGARTPLRPGQWTEVVWTGSYILELSPALGDEMGGERRVNASERLASLSVRVDSDRAYQGFVLIDDLRLYPAKAAPRDDASR